MLSRQLTNQVTQNVTKNCLFSTFPLFCCCQHSHSMQWFWWVQQLSSHIILLQFQYYLRILCLSSQVYIQFWCVQMCAWYEQLKDQNKRQQFLNNFLFYNHQNLPWTLSVKTQINVRTCCEYFKLSKSLCYHFDDSSFSLSLIWIVLRLIFVHKQNGCQMQCRWQMRVPWGLQLL